MTQENYLPDRPEVPKPPPGYKPPPLNADKTSPVPVQQQKLIQEMIKKGDSFGGEANPDLNKIIEKSKYEVKQSDFFRIKFGLKEIEDRWIVVEEDKIDKSGQKTERHWVDFRIWSFDEEIQLKKQATIYNEKRRIHTIDYDVLNELKVRRLIKDWSFSRKNDRLRLFHSNGYLTDESWEMFKSLYPTIVRHMMTKMNDVLEFNE